MGQIRLRDALNALHTVTRIRMRDSSNVLRTVQRIRMRDASNVLRTVWQYFTVSVTPTGDDAYNSGAATSGTVTTTNFTVTVTGGTAPFTYSWARVSGNTVIGAGSSTSATTNFAVANAFDGISYAAQFRCTVTDANGAVAVTDPVAVSLTWIDTTP